MTTSAQPNPPVNYVGSFEVTVVQAGVTVTGYSPSNGLYPPNRIFLVETYIVRANHHLVYSFDIMGLDRANEQVYFDLTETRRVFHIRHIYENGINTLKVYFTDGTFRSMDGYRLDVPLSQLPTAQDLQNALTTIVSLTTNDIMSMPQW